MQHTKSTQKSYSLPGEPPFWKGNDGLDDQIKEASKSILIVCNLNSTTLSKLPNFKLDKFLNTTEIDSNVLDDVHKNIYGWPFYCKVRGLIAMFLIPEF
jgi:predicted ATP-dependent Lon-type protease